MIKIENIKTYGFEAAIHGMRNPMNSWDKSDSYHEDDAFVLGKNDFKLMKQLIKAGADHSKFMRMINVTCDITAPLYWWKEFDAYKVGTVRNSCSTMHKIHSKEFAIDDFSCDIIESDKVVSIYFHNVISICEEIRRKYTKTNDKRYWYMLIQFLPESYNQEATVQLNYQVLRNMYHARKNHKLSEWHDFCCCIKSLPYSELITEDFKNEELL